jgi:hypothetical protein
MQIKLMTETTTLSAAIEATAHVTDRQFHSWKADTDFIRISF